MMNKLAIALVIISLVLFPWGLLIANKPLATIGAICIGTGALMGQLFDMRKRQESAK